ncbi:hypothetical protein HMPREF9135_1620 [Segatella baroniae F0067]|uniref:Uncharacterized protein n=1 Tax=Segatella baroniae F0067 TaxID=1115809 RepID=U2QJ20_9BACT|nr:hypothetical protein HMPREF9135_1620 [Segatella baroniae F0067]
MGHRQLSEESLKHARRFARESLCFQRPKGRVCKVGWRFVETPFPSRPCGSRHLQRRKIVARKTSKQNRC